MTALGSVTYQWAIYIEQDKEWIQYVGGDWGPQYLTTPHLIEATLFCDHEDAQEVADRWPTSKIKRVKIERHLTVEGS